MLGLIKVQFKRKENIMHGPYDDPYLFPSLNGGKPDDYDEYWLEVEANKILKREKEERELYEKLKKKYKE